MYNTFSLSVDEHISCIHVLDVVDSPGMNMALLLGWLCFEGNWGEVIPVLRITCDSGPK